MAKQPKRSKDDSKSKGLDALAQYANKYLIGNKANKIFDEANKIPLNMPKQPIAGFRGSLPSGITGGAMAKAGAYARGAGNTELAKFFGAEEIGRLTSGAKTSPLRKAGDVATLASIMLPFSPAKKLLGTPKDWLALINSFKLFE